MAKEYTELQLKAKEAGVKSWHTKSDEKIEIELSKIEAPSQPIVESTPDEIAEPVVEKVEKPDPMELMEAMLEWKFDWKMAMGSIRGGAQKSPMWKWKDLIIEGYAKDLEKKKAKQNEMASKR
jgi:hypothetical protein